MKERAKTKKEETDAAIGRDRCFVCFQQDLSPLELFGPFCLLASSRRCRRRRPSELHSAAPGNGIFAVFR